MKRRQPDKNLNRVEEPSREEQTLTREVADLHKIFQSSFFVERGGPVRVPLFLCENACVNKEYYVPLHWKKKESAMETGKIKVPVKQALPMIAEMVKLKYVTDALGKSSGWIYNKLNHETTTSKSSGFTQSDINLLNNLFQEIGEKLINTRISIPLEENKDPIQKRKEVIEQILSVSEIISMPFIYINKMGKNLTWYLNRMRRNSLKASFKQDDINMINLAIIEIGNKLLSIELTL